jgi:hypothetical protein
MTARPTIMVSLSFPVGFTVGDPCSLPVHANDMNWITRNACKILVVKRNTETHICGSGPIELQCLKTGTNRAPSVSRHRSTQKVSLS